MQGILFDLDGTIFNSEWLALDAYSKGFQQAMNRELSETEKRTIIGKPISTFLENFPGSETEILEKILKYYEKNLEKIKVYDDIHYMLETLKSQSFKLGIVTSQLKRFVEKNLTRTKLKSYFDVVITADDCYKHKPNPLPLLMAAEHLGINFNDCIYVGDQRTDIAAAHAAGMKSAAVLWGGEQSDISKSLSPTYIFDTPSSLIKTLIASRNI